MKEKALNLLADARNNIVRLTVYVVFVVVMAVGSVQFIDLKENVAENAKREQAALEVAGREAAINSCEAINKSREFDRFFLNQIVVFAAQDGEPLEPEVLLFIQGLLDQVQPINCEDFVDLGEKNAQDVANRSRP